MKRFCIYIYALLATGILYSQGSTNVRFPSLTLHPSARLAGLGTNFATSHLPDMDIAISNSSLLTEELHNHALLNYADYFSAYTNLNVAYARNHKYGMFMGSLQYLNYGNIEAYDEFRTPEGTSKYAYDMVANVGWGKSLDSTFRIGANFKYIFSRMEDFYMNGIAVDVSGSYIKDNQAVSLTFRNIGTMLKSDVITDYEKLPFEIQIAYYQRFAHAPFAFSVVLNNLQKWNLSGVDVNKETINAETGEIEKANKFSTFADNAMRHIALGMEFIPFKNFTFRMGYNYQRRKELLVDTRPAFVGFSWGLGVKIYKFNIEYTRATYHLAGAPNYISVSTNISELVK